METKVENKQSSRNDGNMLLSAGLYRQIMEATGRFEFVKEDLETSIMTLREFIAEISRTKDELLDKEIVIKAENGLLLEPRIKFIPKDIGSLKLDAEHIDKVIVCWD